MKVMKPNWVEHAAGEKKTKSPIYSLSVHPDGTRLATGGQDNKVKIWSTLPILDAEAQENDANHKLLCTMSAHTGPVLTVRWAHHGRYLASGSDDSVLLVWDIDPGGGGRVFGSEEVNVENWKALRRLVGHVADVVDCAWSRDDSMLASVGLDSKIFIWDGYSFERLRTIDTHQGFVKGVTWDPVGNFLATQSDDKTVRIWNTDNWQEVVKISKPFELSPQSTFFRRLSWSPDGAFIAASNAMNGPVFVAAVIDRDSWDSEISFVGHENTIQVAAFNPRLFFRPGEERTRVTASCMLALGADDYSISVWRNTMHKPLAVIRDIFMRPMLDLCWANDGLTLYGCSADGTICAIQFTHEEFPELAEAENTSSVLESYETYKAAQRRAPAPQRALTVSSSFGAGSASTTEHVNVIVPRKGKPKARRINLAGTMGQGANGSSASGSSFSGGGRAPLARPTAPRSPVNRRANAADAFAAAADAPLRNRADSSARDRMFQHAGSAFDDDGPRAGDKRKAYSDVEEPPRLKGRAMGGASRPLGTVQEIRAPRVVFAAAGGASVRPMLPVPSVQSGLRQQQEDGSGVLTAENSAEGSNALTFAHSGKDQWVDYTPSPALAIAAGSSFCAAACEDGTVKVYSHAGRHLASLKLESPVSEFAASRDMLFIVTADCTARVFDTKKNKLVLGPTSLAHLLEPSGENKEKLTILDAFVRPNGCPVVLTSEPSAWAYDTDLSGWTQIAAPWWSSSPLREGRTRGRSQPTDWVLAELEQRVAAALDAKVDAPEEKPKWWDESLSIGHYETRLRAARLLESKDEYRHWLREYSKFLGEENFRERAEELVAELMGPIYYLPGKPDWNPKMLGMAKRDLAKDALGAMRQTVSLGQYATDQLQTLKRIQQEETQWTP